jgi:hypothetical protein
VGSIRCKGRHWGRVVVMVKIRLNNVYARVMGRLGVGVGLSFGFMFCVVVVAVGVGVGLDVRLGVGKK